MTQKSFAVLQIIVALAFSASASLLALPQKTEAALTDGLVGYWTFNGPDFSDKIYDRSGQNWVSTLMNESTSTAKVLGKLGQAISFDGVDAFVQVGTVVGTDPIGVGTVTVCMWINPRNWTNDAYLLGNNQFEVMSFAAETSLHVISTSAGGAGDFGVLPAVNTWTHLCVIRLSGANGVSTLYLNGAQSGSSVNSGTPALGDDAFVLGARRGDGNGSFAGSEDDVRIYNRALSADEVKQLYLKGNALTKPANNLGLLRYYSFDDATTTQATDFSGNGNTGTLTSTGTVLPTWVNGKRGSALNFDGSTNYLDTPSLTSPSAGTMSMWMNPNNVTVGRIWGNNDNFEVAWSSARLSGDICGGSSITSSVGNSFTTGRWYHVVITWDDVAEQENVYINGVLDSNANTTIACAQVGNLDIAFRPGATAGEEFDGLIDDVRLYSRMLSASEVAKLYAGGTSGATRANTSSVTLQNGTTLGPANNLVGHWTFDGADIQSAIIDRSGNNNNGYFTGIATSSAKTIGKLGQALDLNKVADYVHIGTMGSFGSQLGNGVTVAAWVNIQTGTTSAILSGIDTNFNAPLRVTLNTDTSGFAYQLGGAAITINDNSGKRLQGGINSGLPQNRWTHVVLTALPSSNTITAYIDGQSQTIAYNDQTTPSVFLNFSDSFDLGRDQNNAPAHYFNGKMDDVRVYNRVLTAAEVKQLYQLGTTKVQK